MRRYGIGFAEGNKSGDVNAHILIQSHPTGSNSDIPGWVHLPVQMAVNRLRGEMSRGRVGEGYVHTGKHAEAPSSFTGQFSQTPLNPSCWTL